MVVAGEAHHGRHYRELASYTRAPSAPVAAVSPERCVAAKEAAQGISLICSDRMRANKLSSATQLRRPCQHCALQRHHRTRGRWLSASTSTPSLLQPLQNKSPGIIIAKYKQPVRGDTSGLLRTTTKEHGCRAIDSRSNISRSSSRNQTHVALSAPIHLRCLVALQTWSTQASPDFQ